MSPLVVFILFFVFLLIAIPISVSLGLVAVLPGVFDPSFTASASYVIRSMESTVSHSLQYRCLFYPVSLWQEVESQKDFLIYFHFSLENVQQVCHVRQ